KMEAIGLAIATELPLVICDIQRGGPSTGLPTKTEQADLLQALFGRNSEAPVPVLAASTPGDCFWVALEASRIAVKYMVPVIILSDGYLANGAEPWKIPTVEELPSFPVRHRTDPSGFHPYQRDAATLARPWVVPAKYLVDAEGFNKIQGKPFKQSEIEAKIEEVLGVRGQEIR